MGPGHGIEAGHCPNCNLLIVEYLTGICQTKGGDTAIFQGDVGTTQIIYPFFSTRPVEPEVPQRFRETFIEAASIQQISPKASAALSRRILQDVLRSAFGIQKHNLAKEIEEFIALKDVPTYLAEAVDAVRNIGNFAAHPLKDTHTGEIIDVEPGEAEWILDVLESLFDFAYVQPARLAEKKLQLNEKLKNIGKPPMISPIQ